MSTINPDIVLKESDRRHRRDVLITIVLPLAGGVLLIALVMLLVILLPRTQQVSLVADLTMTALMLCPLALCLLPISLGLVTAAVMSGRLHKGASKPLRRVEALSVEMSNRAVSIGERASKLSIRFNAIFAPLLDWIERVFGTGEPTTNPVEGEDKL
ncbi:MAG: hypothetical protein IT320_01415 [Anaerolineae bacterium]|nr:hypothetical protein [Anaerolineae bacterium]